ncbi:hypothetical protein Tco_1411766, partial [Tanacetum coccineum]
KQEDDEDDKSIDIEKTDDDEETDDEFVHGGEYVHDDVDVEMKDVEVAETGKDGEEITDAEKTDAEKTEVTNCDHEQAGKLPLTSSSLSVSFGFGNQFLNLSSITSLIGTTKESTNIDINSLLDIQIQQQVPHIQSRSILTVPNSVIPEPTVLLPIPETPTVTPHIQDLKQVDQSPLIIATIRSQVPATIDEYLGSNLRKRDREEDEDPSAGSNQEKRKRSSGKESEPSRKSSASNETLKGDTLPKSSKTCKSVSAEESVKEAIHEVIIGDEEPVQENVNDTDQPQDVIIDQHEQNWFNDLLSAEKDPLTFDELMATPIDFSNFEMNRLKINKITKAHLVGPVYNLLKGTCQSSIELEYNMEECYKAISEQLDWNNPKGDR